MKIRGLHRILGIILILPFPGWVATGLFFSIKPGYKGAYESLKPAIRALENLPHIQGDGNWLEYRMVRTVLGLHLLVKTGEGPLHLDGDGSVREFSVELKVITTAIIFLTLLGRHSTTAPFLCISWKNFVGSSRSPSF